MTEIKGHLASGGAVWLPTCGHEVLMATAESSYLIDFVFVAERSKKTSLSVKTTDTRRGVNHRAFCAPSPSQSPNTETLNLAQSAKQLGHLS